MNMDVDYTKYTLAELRDCREHIDEVAYPERVKMIEEQISIRIKNGEAVDAPKEYSEQKNKAFKLAWVNLVTSVFFGFLALMGIISGSIGNAAKIGNYTVTEEPFEFWLFIFVLVALSCHRLYKAIKLFGESGI